MYEYPKEILVFRRNTNQPLTTANIGGYFIFNIADYDDSQLEKYTKSSLQVFIRCETELCRYGDYFDIRPTKSNRRSRSRIGVASGIDKL